MPEVSQCIPQLLVSYTSSVCSLKSQKAQSQGIQEVTSSCRGINLQREPHCTAVLYLFRTFCKKMVHLLVWQRTGVPWLHRVGVPICQRAGVPAGRGQVSQLSEDRCPALRGQVSMSPAGTDSTRCLASSAIRWHSRLTLHFPPSAAVSRGHRQGTKGSGSGFTPFQRGNAVRKKPLMKNR